MMLFVRLTPRAAREALGGVAVSGERSHLQASVRALPEKGAANAALTRLLAGQLGLPQSAIRVARGASARYKAIEIAGDPRVLSPKLARLCSDVAKPQSKAGPK
jgi:hypothetical protein